MEKVIEEFYNLSLAQEYITEGGINYAKEILEKAFGASKSEIILKKMTASLKSNGPFDFVKTMDPSKIAQLIKDEHPQTIALILYNIKYQPHLIIKLLIMTIKERRIADNGFGTWGILHIILNIIMNNFYLIFYMI